MSPDLNPGSRSAQTAARRFRCRRPRNTLRVTKRGKFPLESLHRRTADETCRLQSRLKTSISSVLSLLVRRHQIYKGNVFVRSSFASSSLSGVERRAVLLAGFPATITFAGTSRVTTLPAPTMAFSPTSHFDRIVEPEPIEAPRLTRVASTRQSFSRLQFAFCRGRSAGKNH